MTESVRARLISIAWRNFLDPGTLGRDVDAAEKVLLAARGDLRGDLDGVLLRAVTDLAPDRLSRLSAIVRSVPRDPVSPHVTAGLVAAFREARGQFDRELALWPLRRAESLAGLIVDLESASCFSAEDVLWLGANVDPRSIYRALAVWCAGHDPVPADVAALVRELRANEEDSPILDRLAAWVVPSPEGMRDLAGWENGYRRVADSDWSAATARWTSGVRDREQDAPMLRQTLECSANTDAMRLAVERHGEAALSELRSAHASETVPVFRVLFEAWLENFGGVR